MEFTGERFVPERHGQIELEHLHRYLQAKPYAQGKVVLDIASGEGYGTQLLSEVASFAYGVDVSSEAIRHAKEKYSNETKISFMVGDCASIPLESASVDFVCSFETIEHHDQHEAMMQEIRRVLKPDGLFMVSSPDKFVYSESINYTNPFHVKELYKEEFENLMRQYFKEVAFFSQKVVYGSVIASETGGDEFTHITLDQTTIVNQGLSDAPYLLAIASNATLPPVNCGVLETPLNKAELTIHLSNELQRLQSSNSDLQNELNLQLKKWRRRGGPLGRLFRKIGRKLFRD